MGTTFTSLMPILPLVAGAAILPLWITVTLLLLRAEGGVAKAAAFASGAIAVRLVQGVLFGYILGGATGPEDAEKADVISATLQLLAGIVLLVTAAGSWLRGEDPDAPPPRWMTALGGIRALGAIALGALMMALSLKQWVFTLSAVAVIDDAGLGRAGSVGAYVAFVAAAHAMVLTPTIAYAASPERAGRALDAAGSWLERNGKVITLGASLVFGIVFLTMGVTGLHDDLHEPARNPSLGPAGGVPESVAIPRGSASTI